MSIIYKKRNVWKFKISRYSFVPLKNYVVKLNLIPL